MVDMYDSPMQGPDITLLLNRAVDGDVEAATAVWTTVHREVHAMAVNAVRNEPNANALEASVIVSEVFLKVTGKRREPWESRRHFFGAVARAMEQYLIDTPRAMRTQKKHVAFVTESVVRSRTRCAVMPTALVRRLVRTRLNYCCSLESLKRSHRSARPCCDCATNSA